MANPSLQIGNSNWAIKEDNLLGYSTAGTKFLPQPITMTRASAGTRVNSSGLVETVELLGSELVTNGDFSNGSTGWFNDPSLPVQYFNVINQSLHFENTSGTVTFFSSASFSVDANKTYKFTINTVKESGTDDFDITLRPSAGSSVVENITSTHQSGLLEYYFTSASNQNLIIQFTQRNTIKGIIDNVSVKESTKNNLARVDYDGTASSLLVEPQRTNLLPYSEDFANSDWTKNAGTTITPNYAISPNGNLNASRYLGTGASGLGDKFTLNPVSNTLSFFVKSNTGQNQFCRILGDSNQSSGNLLVTTEWSRITHTFTASGNANKTNGIFRDLSDNDIDILIWGGQLEEGSYATSYIPTSGSTVTRVQDQYSKTGISNLINSEEGVLFAEIAAFEGANTDRQISISDGSTSNRVVMALLSNGTQIQFVVSSGGSITVNTTQTIPTIISGTKIAFAYKVNNFKIYANGILIASDTNGTVPTGLSVLAFNRGDGNDIFFGKVKQLQVYKTALTDTELATLTTI